MSNISNKNIYFSSKTELMSKLELANQLARTSNKLFGSFMGLNNYTNVYHTRLLQPTVSILINNEFSSFFNHKKYYLNNNSIYNNLVSKLCCRLDTSSIYRASSGSKVLDTLSSLLMTLPRQSTAFHLKGASGVGLLSVSGKISQSRNHKKYFMDAQKDFLLEGLDLKIINLLASNIIDIDLNTHSVEYTNPLLPNINYHVIPNFTDLKFQKHTLKYSPLVDKHHQLDSYTTTNVSLIDTNKGASYNDNYLVSSSNLLTELKSHKKVEDSQPPRLVSTNKKEREIPFDLAEENALMVNKLLTSKPPLISITTFNYISIYNKPDATCPSEGRSLSEYQESIKNKRKPLSPETEVIDSYLQARTVHLGSTASGRRPLKLGTCGICYSPVSKATRCGRDEETSYFCENCSKLCRFIVKPGSIRAYVYCRKPLLPQTLQQEYFTDPIKESKDTKN